MAEQQSGETIRQMLSGFNSMQMQLGIIPMATSQAPMGVPFQPAPPPPQVQHPGMASQQAVQQHQMQVQQTLQAAQMTRYTPPPSTYIGGGGASPMQTNPFMGMGPAGGGGGAMGPSMQAMQQQRLPATGMNAIFNPFAPTQGTPHFQSMGGMGYQNMQGLSSQSHAIDVSKLGVGGMSFGGAAIGASLGSAFGPVGTFLGHMAGDAIGGALGNTVFKGLRQDLAHGRQMQNMTQSSMVTGGILNPFTGAGMDRNSGYQTAQGLRHLATRDHGFGRDTGFNTNDVMRITQMASDQKMLLGAQSPEAITSKVKEIAQTVKMLTSITGDPDIRNAMQSLGQMKSLGFNGLAGQAGAIGNRVEFARMGGVSQNAMNGFGMSGAAAANAMGMVGATGYTQGMQGAASAHIARSAGALNNLQLARAGGEGGLAAMNTQAALGSLSNPLYMQAALKRGANGKLDVDMDEYRRVQSMDPGDVARLASKVTQALGKEGVTEMHTRSGELRDSIAQKMDSMEMQMNALKQARALMQKVPSMDLGAALAVTTGDADTGRALALQAGSREYWDGQIQQRKITQRNKGDLERKARGQYRQASMFSRVTNAIGDEVGGVFDRAGDGLHVIGSAFDEASDDDNMTARGARVIKYGKLEQATTEGARAGIKASQLRHRNDPLTQGNYSGRIDTGTGLVGFSAGLGLVGFSAGLRNRVGNFIGFSAGLGNRVGNFLGFSAKTDANKVADLANKSWGRDGFLEGSFSGSYMGQSAHARVMDVASFGEAAKGGSSENTMQLAKKLQAGGTMSGSASSLLSAFESNFNKSLGSNEAGYVQSAYAVSESQTKATWIKTAKDRGIDAATASKMFETDKVAIMGAGAAAVRRGGDTGRINALNLSGDIAEGAGSLGSGARGGAAMSASGQALLAESGLGANAAVTDEIYELLAKTDGSGGTEVVAYAALLQSGDDKAREAFEAKILAQPDGERKLRELGKKSREVQGRLSTKGKEVLGRYASKQGAGLEASLGKVQRGVEDIKHGAAQTNFAQEVAEKLKKVDPSKASGLKGAGTDKIFSSISGTEIDAMFGDDPRKAALWKKAIKGDKDAQETLSGAAAVTSGSVTYGGEGSGGDPTISDMEAWRDEIAGEGDKKSTLQAESAVALTKAASKLEIAAEKMLESYGVSALEIAKRLGIEPG